MRTPFILLAALAVSACNSYEPATPVDVVMSSQSAKPAGFHVVAVRTFVTTSGKKNEVKGVPCQLRGSGFSSSFQSPASVNVPTYGPSSRAIETKCTYNGVTETKVSAPVNITEQKAISSGASGGLLGALVVAAVVSGREDKATDEFGYQVGQFEFKAAK